MECIVGVEETRWDGIDDMLFQGYRLLSSGKEDMDCIDLK